MELTQCIALNSQQAAQNSATLISNALVRFMNRTEFSISTKTENCSSNYVFIITCFSHCLLFLQLKSLANERIPHRQSASMTHMKPIQNLITYFPCVVVGGGDIVWCKFRSFENTSHSRCQLQWQQYALYSIQINSQQRKYPKH